MKLSILGVCVLGTVLAASGYALSQVRQDSPPAPAPAKTVPPASAFEFTPAAVSAPVSVPVMVPAPPPKDPVPAPALKPAKAARLTSSNIKSFEFLGCSGDWTDKELRPRAWRVDRKAKTTFLIKHPADCGYTIGSHPKAKIAGSSIDFSYEMSNDDGPVALCYCEYWASFELKSVPDRIARISINGDKAKLMSGLTER